MEKLTLREKFDELLADYSPMEEINRLYERALEAGVLHVVPDQEIDFRIPKIIFYAVLLKMASDCQPVTPENKYIAEELLLRL